MHTKLVTLALELAGKDPPSEFRMLAAGPNKSRSGTFLFDDKAANDVQRFYAEHGIARIPFDYEHKQLDTDARVDDKKAAGSFVPAVRNGELWATDIRWTPKAEEEIRNGEWLYFSPAFLHDKDTKRVTRLVNCALTNLPALDGIDPLMAPKDKRVNLAEGLSFDEVRDAVSKAVAVLYPMRLWHIEGIYDDRVIVELEDTDQMFSINYHLEGGRCVFDGEPVEVQEQYVPVSKPADTAMTAAHETPASGRESTSMLTVLRALGLTEKASEAEALSEVTRIRGFEGEVMKLAEKATLGEAIGTIAGWKSAAIRLSEVERENGALREKLLDGEREALIKANERKISPAMLSWAKSQNLESLKAFLAVAPDVSPVGQAPAQPPAHDTTIVALSEAERAVARAGGMTDQEFATAKARIESRKVGA